MSLFVAVTLVPVLCSRLLVLPPPRRPAQRHRRLALHDERADARTAMDDGYRRLLHLALAHRPTVVGLSAASVVAAALIFPTLPTEFSTQTDEGQVQVNVELPQGTRIEVTDAGAGPDRGRWCTSCVPEATDVIVNAGGGGFGGRRRRSGRRRRQPRQHPAPADAEGRADALERADRHRPAPAAVGHPGRDRPRQRVGRQQPDESLPLGRRQRRRGGGRLRSRSAARTSTSRSGVAQAAKDLLDTVPGIADARLGRDEGRPELAVRVDRAKAALLGVSATTVANTIRTNVAGTQAAMFRAGRQRVSRSSSGCARTSARAVTDVDDVLVSTPQGQVLPAKNLMQRRERGRPGLDRAEEPAAHRLRERRAGDRR